MCADIPLIADVSELSGSFWQDNTVGPSGNLCPAGPVTNMRWIAAKPVLIRVAALTFVLVMAGSAPSLADDHRRDQDAAREAVERGEIKPLADLLVAIRSKLPGEVVGVEIERKQSGWMYELRVADSKGRLFEVHVNARTGTIDRVKEK